MLGLVSPQLEVDKCKTTEKKKAIAHGTIKAKKTQNPRW